MDKTEPFLSTVRPWYKSMNASTFFEGPPSQDIQSRLTGETSDGRRPPKHSRSNGGDRNRRGDVQKWNHRSLPSYFAAAGDREIVMQVSTVTTATGGLCLLLAVFSGTALVFLGVIALGLYGMGYSLRQHGALRYLPRSLAEWLTRTSLLEFLTDTRMFDAMKTYSVFMMGLSPEETQRVLETLPADMRTTLTRPGLIYTLPEPLQRLLLPDESSTIGRSNLTSLRRLDQGRGESCDGEDEDDGSPLGRLVWNAILPEGMPEASLTPVAGDASADSDRSTENASSRNERRGTGDQLARVNGEHRDHRVHGDDDGDLLREDDHTREVNPAHDETLVEGEFVDGSGAAGVGGDATDGGRASEGRDGLLVQSSTLQPFIAPLGAAPASRSPHESRGRSQTDSVLDSEGPALLVPELERRRQLVSARGDDANQAGDEGRLVTSSRSVERAAGVGSLVPSAEKIVASILQARLDNAVQATWDLVDQRRVRRVAIVSTLALAAHVALSARARRQAGSMVRGGVLAALAGTASVCAGLLCLNPRLARGEETGGAEARTLAATTGDTARDSSRLSGPSSAEGQAESEGVHDRARRSGVRRRLGWVVRWIARHRPGLESTISMLAMVCLLLAVRRWQMLRRTAGARTLAGSAYGASVS